MRFMPRFDAFRGPVWVCLLVLTLWVAAPVCAEEVSTSVVGQITAVDGVRRAIEIEGDRYTLAAQTEVKSASRETPKVMSIADLKVGQYVEFKASGNVIQSLGIFENGPPQ